MARYLVTFLPGNPIPTRTKYIDDAVGPPDANVDAGTDGVAFGSILWDGTDLWFCTSAVTAAATWEQIGGSGVGGGTDLGWFNVMDYSAVGDGVADDTVAAQDAIDAAGVGGGVVYFPPGEYKISAEATGQRYALRLDASNVILMGAGMLQTILTFDSTQTLPAGSVFHPIEIGTASAGVSHIIIRDLSVVANHSSLEAGGTEFINAICARHSTTPTAHCDDVLIERVRVKDANVGIVCLKDGTEGSGRTASRHERWTVRDCLIDTTVNKAIEFDEVQDSAILDNVCINVQDGAQIANFSDSCRIDGNRIEYKDSGINVVEGCDDIDVGNNIVVAIPGGGLGLTGGIVIRRESYTSTGPTSSRVKIHHNIVDDSLNAAANKIGIQFATYTGNTGVATFEDHEIYANTFVADINYLHDAWFPAKSQAVRLRIYDNDFTDEVMTHASWVSDRTRLERNHVGGDLTIASDDWDLRGNVVDGTLTITGTGYTLDDRLIGNVLVSATPPTSGQSIVASSGTAAAWGTAPAGTPATTVESETTFGLSPAVGTDTEYARQDHTHGSPAAPTGGGLGPLLLASDHGAPLVFDDILQASDGSDFLYASEP